MVGMYITLYLLIGLCFFVFNVKKDYMKSDWENPVQYIENGFEWIQVLLILIWPCVLIIAAFYLILLFMLPKK